MNEIENRDGYNRIYARDRGQCQTCRKQLAYGKGERAHRIAKSKDNIGRYGKGVIFHDDCMALACPGKCNSAQNIGFKTRQADQLAKEIRSTIYQAAIAKIERSPGLYIDLIDDLAEVAS